MALLQIRVRRGPGGLGLGVANDLISDLKAGGQAELDGLLCVGDEIVAIATLVAVDRSIGNFLRLLSSAAEVSGVGGSAPLGGPAWLSDVFLICVMAEPRRTPFSPRFSFAACCSARCTSRYAASGATPSNTSSSSSCCVRSSID